MKNWIKVISFAGIVCIGILIYVWFFVYNKPHKDIEKATPEYVITALSCYNHYANEKNSESLNYTGKVLQISGMPTSIEKADSSIIVVFAFNSGIFGDEGIRCTMLPSYNNMLNNLSLTENITIKGFCSGYNETDVILEQCSIIKN
jgi:tRNA_anti-like